MTSTEVEARIKVVSLGSTGVGKSCLVKRYCEGRFVSKYIPTIGIDYGVKRVSVRTPPHIPSTSPTLSVRVNFWDMAGGPEYVEIRNEFYNSAEGIVLIYDVCDPSSFAALDGWLKEMETFRDARSGEVVTAPPNGRGEARGSLSTKGRPPIVVVCANKVDDETGAKRRAVSEADGRRWAEGKGFKYFETSACSGLRVAEALETLFQDVVTAFM